MVFSRDCLSGIAEPGGEKISQVSRSEVEPVGKAVACVADVANMLMRNCGRV